MQLLKSATAVFFGLLLAGPASADQERVDPLDPRVMFSGIVTEHDVSMLFDYVRSAMFAASQGFDPPPPPPDLQRRVEAIGDAVKGRGALAALMMLNALEISAKQAFRDRPPVPRLPPPSVSPYTPLKD